MSPPDRDHATPRRGDLLALLLVAGLAAAPFLPTLKASFLNYDDPWQITQNPYIRSLSPTNLLHILTRPIYQIWLPTKTLSYALDYALWGLDPRGFHATSVTLHAAAAVLVFLLARRLLGGRLGATVAAVLFAVHPVHVEAVAWLSARKDLLSTVFVLVSVLGFLRWWEGAGRGKWFWYAVSLAAFLAASRAKPTAHVLPVLLVCLGWVQPEGGEGGKESRGRLWRLLLAVLPFFLLAVGLSLVDWSLARGFGYTARRSAGGVLKAAVASAAAARYLRLLFFPVGLSPQYRVSRPGGFADPWVLVGAAFWAAGVVLAGWALRRRRPAGSALAWYLVAVLPVCGLLPISVPSPVADRYLYLPSVGACLVAGWGVGVLAGRLERGWRGALAVALGVVVTAFAVQSWVTSGIWRDSETLWSAVLERDPKNYNAEVNLGAALFDRGDYEGALEHYRRATELAPGLIHAYRSLGAIHLLKGELDEARYWLRRAATDPPAHVLTRSKVLRTRSRACFQLGQLEESQGNLATAVENYERAYRLSETTDLRALLAAARVRTTLGQLTRSRAYLQELTLLLEQGPQGQASGKGPRARESVERLLAKVEGRMKRAHDRLTVARAALAAGKKAVAEKYLRRALAEQADLVEASVALSALLREEGRVGEALAVVEEGLTLSPGEPGLVAERQRVLEALRRLGSGGGE